MDDWWKPLIIAAVEGLIVIATWSKVRSEICRSSFTMAVISAVALVLSIVSLFLLNISIPNELILAAAVAGLLLGMSLFSRSEVAMAATFLSGAVTVIVVWRLTSSTWM